MRWFDEADFPSVFFAGGDVSVGFFAPCDKDGNGVCDDADGDACASAASAVYEVSIDEN